MGISDLLSAFRGLPRTVSSRRPTYNADDLSRLSGGRDCFVVVHGNPFLDCGCDGETFIETVVAAMQGQNFGRAVRFTARSAANTHPDYRVTLLFNGVATVRATDLCSEGSAQIPTEPLGANGQVRMLASWCREGSVLSEVSGWIEGIKSATDRRFIRLVAQVTRDLFPPGFDPRPGFKDT